MEWVGHVPDDTATRRHRDLQALEWLVRRYPVEARAILAHVEATEQGNRR